MSGQNKAKAQSVEQKINESAPHGSVGYKVFSADTNTYYPVRAIQGREFFKLGKGLESPAGVPTGTYQIHYIDAGGKPIYLAPLPTVRIGRSGAYRKDPTDDSADSESEHPEDGSRRKSRAKPRRALMTRWRLWSVLPGMWKRGRSVTSSLARCKNPSTLQRLTSFLIP